MNFSKNIVNILLVTIVLISLCEARGGRRGGSFGGLFGSWRKYKKPSSGGGSSRRIVSSSPVHTPITKAWHENKKTSNGDKVQKQMYNGYNTQPLPTGGSYYRNTAALPGNVIFVPQAPPRGAEFGDFLTGYLTGRLLTMGFPSPHYRVTHVYRESPAISKNATKPNNTSQVDIINSQQEMSTEKVFNASLAEFTTTEESFTVREERSTTTDKTPLTLLSSTTESSTPSYGVICMPILISENNSNGETVQNERIVCYPAPAPLTAQKDMKSEPVEIAGDIMEH